MSSVLSSYLPRISFSGIGSNAGGHGAAAHPSQLTSSLSPILLALVIVSFTFTAYHAFIKPSLPLLFRPAGNSSKIVQPLIPVLGETRFYDHRDEWVESHMHFEKSGDEIKPIRISVHKYVVTLLSGLSAAKSFFANRDLAFNDGYMTLFAGVDAPEEDKPSEPSPEYDEKAARATSLEGPRPRSEPGSSQFFIKHVKYCLSNARMEEDDVMRKIAGDYWDGVKNYVLPESKIDGTGPAVKGKTGLFPAHKHLYFIMFQVSMRVVGSSEIIRDREKMQPMLDAYWDQENNASFINVFYNWLPIKSNKKRKEGGVNLYMGLRAPIDNRIAEGRTEQDYVQRMIDFNVPVDDIVRWLIGALFASIINTSGMTTWTLIYASADPKIWKKMQAEIDSTIGRLSAARGMPDSASTHDKIAAITIEEWEAEFNFTYWCLRETMRLLSNDFALRKVANRHGGDGTELAGQKVKNAEFAGFYMESIHRDPSIYPDPSKYDPERWERGQGHGNMEFVGWGVGLHPCVGMKLAKNEIKMALAFFVSLMDMEPVDDKGNRYTAENLPTPKKMGQLRAPSKPLQLRYTMRGVR